MRPPVRFNKVVCWLRRELPMLADAMGHLPTERMLCGISQSSLTTVRKAMLQLESEGLVIRRHGRGTFLRIPGISSKALDAQDKTGGMGKGTLGLLIHHSLRRLPGPGIYSQAALGFCNEASERGYPVCIHVINDNKVSIERFLGSPRPEGLLGFGLLGIASRDLQQSVQALGVPLVNMDHWSMDGIAADSFETDSEGDTSEVVRVLLSLGHRRIALLDRAESKLNPARRSGYILALSESGLGIDSRLIVPSIGHPEFAKKALDELMKLPDPPTAIIVFEPRLAKYIVDACGMLGASVPRDLSVVGFGGVHELKDPNWAIGLMATDFFRLGRLAAEKLLSRIAGESSALRRELVPGCFYFGQTIGQAPWKAGVSFDGARH